MKKLLIIIGISVFFLMIAVGAAYNSQIIHVDQLYRNMPSSTCYQPTTDKPHEDAVWNLDECYWFVDDPYVEYSRFASPTGLGILHALDVADKEKLQKILDDCNTPSMGLDISRELTNGTHTINNITCEWKLVEKDPNPTNLGGPIIVDDFISDDETLLDKYKDLPEVVAFYAKYDDAQVSVREVHISYFAGNEDDFKIRMNLEFDENYEINNIELHCYVKRIHQNEVAQSFILKYLKDYTCDEYGSQRTGNIQIRGDMADQICSIIGDECPSYFIGNMQKDGSVMVGIVVSNQDQIKQYQFFIKNNILSYDVTINEN